MTNKQINITGAIFDFDGTLFDSMHVWRGYKDNFFNHLGIELTEDDIEAFKGLFLRETFLLAIERFNLDKTYEELLSDLFLGGRGVRLSGLSAACRIARRSAAP